VTAIRAVVVDDSPVFREELVAFLEELGVTVAGEAATGEESLELVESARPDVVLLDLGLPAMSGLEAARQLQRLGQRPAIVIVSMHDDPATRAEGLEAGARAFIAKHELVERLPSTLEGLFPEALAPADIPPSSRRATEQA